MRRGLALAVALASLPARANEKKAVRRPDATWKEIFDGPFVSSRLFAMPTAAVVGPYQLSLSGDGSLLSKTGSLAASSVMAIGFGDIAQLEYRLAGAVSTLQLGASISLPTVGAQFTLPFAERKYVPSLAAAIRLGLPRHETDAAGVSFAEKATDLYVVTSLRLWGVLRAITLHGGLRVAAANVTEEDTGASVSRTLLMPAAGIEARITPRTRFVGELSLVPAFEPAENGASQIGARPYGRLGVRWFVHPALSIDASIGYRVDGASSDGLVGWDMRLGLEVFVPVGAILCRTGKVFCE
jgi:hypothetical protein